VSSTQFDRHKFISTKTRPRFFTTRLKLWHKASSGLQYVSATAEHRLIHSRRQHAAGTWKLFNRVHWNYFFTQFCCAVCASETSDWKQETFSLWNMKFITASLIFCIFDKKFVCYQRTFETACPNVTKFSVHIITCCRVSVLWRQCNRLCTSGFVNDVMFSHNEANGIELKATRMFRRVRQVAVAGAKLLSTIAGL